jgi:hypothetical protein
MSTKRYTIGGQLVIAERNKSAMGNRPVVKGPLPLWYVRDLPPLQVGDIFAFKADHGFEQWVVSKQNATTWHYAVAGQSFDADSFRGPDREIIGSINKGVATELLSAYGYRHMRIYRPKIAKSLGFDQLFLRRCDYYGAYEYNWLGLAETAIEYYLREFGVKIHLPLSHRFYCIQFVARLWKDFGTYLVNDWELATPLDMEQSPNMDRIWGTF